MISSTYPSWDLERALDEHQSTVLCLPTEFYAVKSENKNYTVDSVLDPGVAIKCNKVDSIG